MNLKKDIERPAPAPVVQKAKRELKSTPTKEEAKPATVETDKKISPDMLIKIKKIKRKRFNQIRKNLPKFCKKK
jgi:hypothetical protein